MQITKMEVDISPVMFTDLHITDKSPIEYGYFSIGFHIYTYYSVGLQWQLVLYFTVITKLLQRKISKYDGPI